MARIVKVFGFILTGLAVLLLVLISPFALRGLGAANNFNWERLSYIGQTYGAASAVLSATALIGVSISLLVQAQQARAEKSRFVRERHNELLSIVLENPRAYGPVIGLDSKSSIESKQYVFCTMWANYARMLFEIGSMNETGLREDLFGPAFRKEPMRKWWSVSRRYWVGEMALTKKDRKLADIIESEYRKAVSEYVPSRDRMIDKQETTKSSKFAGAMIMGGLGVAAGYFLRSYSSSRRQ